MFNLNLSGLGYSELPNFIMSDKAEMERMGGKCINGQAIPTPSRNSPDTYKFEKQE